MFKLFWANLKMMFRNRQALFWSLAFPLMFTIIFGFFFGGEKTSIGTISLLNQSKSELAQNLEKSLKDSGLFKVQNEIDLSSAHDKLKNNKIVAIVEIPESFAIPGPNADNKIKIIYDPANSQTNGVIINYINGFLTQANFKVQNVQPLFGSEEEKTNNRSLNYFDFVLMGLIGLALMNSSIQGIAISIAKYREDKILKRITTTPLKSWKFIFSEVLSRLVLNLIQVSLILIIGIYFFKAHIYGSVFLIFAFALLGGILFQTIGFAIASFAKTTDAAQGMSISITIPMMFLAGVFFPIDQLPKWLFTIVQYLPLAPLLRMIRQIALEQISPLTNPINIIIVLSWIIVILLVSIKKFKLSEE